MCFADSSVPQQGLQLWLSADTGMVANQNHVSQWGDNSGNGIAVTQATTASQPTLVSNVINGKPVVRFDDSQSDLDFTLPINGLKAMTMIMVSANTQNQDGGSNGSNNAPLSWDETGYWGSVHLSPYQNSVRFRFGTGQVNNLPSYTRPQSIGSSFSLTTAVKNGANEFLYVNGTQVLSLSGKVPTIANVSAQAHLGKGYQGTFAGDIAEVLVYNRALSDTERQQVESYLQSKYFPPQAASPVPAQGLSMWLKADAGVVQSNQVISRWSDQSANHADATQGTAGSQPSFMGSVINGEPVVRFNGTSQFMNFSSPVSGLNGMTIVLVSASAADNDGSWNGTDSAPITWNETGDWGTVDLNPMQRYVKYRFGTGQTNNLPVYNRTASIANNFSISTVIKSGVNEALYVNGNQVLSQSGKLSTVANVSASAYLGRGYTGFFSGDIAEVLVYNRALSDSERQTLEQYLKSKYFSTPTVISQPPTVSAGGNQGITLPASASLTGTASSATSSNVSVAWTTVSGPGTVTFSAPASLSTNASFSAAGTYQLRLVATAGSLSTTSDCTVVVAAAISTPITTSQPTAPTPVNTTSGSNNATYSTDDFVYPSNVGYFNVKNYGAKGDGTTDDTAAIQAAMKAAINDNNNTPTVYFPSGTYVVSQSLMWIQYSSDPAKITASLSGGCISSFTVSYGGSGYATGWNGYGGLYVSGGGGSGILNVGTILSGNKVTGVNMTGKSCVGQGFVSPPTVQAVNWKGWLRFEGQNKANTKIKLKDNTPAFSNANCSVTTTEGLPRENCQAVIYTASNLEPNANGAGEAAYDNDIWNLTIDTGVGNAGAIGIDWMASNRGSIRNVDIISEDGTGRCGLNLSRSAADGGGGGPAFIKNVSIQGFDYGINANIQANQVGYTFDRINLDDQNLYGVLNGGMPNWFHNVTSTNSVPVFVNQGSGNLTVIGGNFVGGSASNSAVLSRVSTGQGITFVRDVATSGYRSALATGSNDTPTAGMSISEYFSAPAISLFPSTMTSLNIPNIPDAIEWSDNNFNDWADVTKYGADSTGGHDSTSAIQAALNSGKPVIFFPLGTYITTSTLHIPSTVRKLIGSSSQLGGSGSTRQQFPVLSCESTSGNPVEIRNFNFDITTVGFPTFQNNCSSDLVIADVFNANGYQNGQLGTGQLFLENAAIPGPSTFNSETVFAKQFDVESGSSTHVTINSGTVWVLGYKTEGLGTLLQASNAKVEILGGAHYNNSGSISQPGYLFTNSSFSLSDVVLADGWPNSLTESRNGVSKTVTSNGAWAGSGTGFTLYSGHN